MTAGLFVVGTVAMALVLDALNASWAPWPDAVIFIGTLVAFGAQGLGLVEFWLVRAGLFLGAAGDHAVS